MHWTPHPHGFPHWLCPRGHVPQLPAGLSALGRSPRAPSPLKLAPWVHVPPRAPLQPLFVQSTFSREIPPAWEHPGRPVVGRGASELGLSWRCWVECDPSVPQPPHPPAGSLPLTRSLPSLPSSRISLPSALFLAQSPLILTTQISTQKSASEGDPH